MLVGLTGAIGAGKSTLARLLAARGAAVIDADRLGHAVVEHPEVAAALRRAFGGDIARADGTLDRQEIGRRAFASPEGRDLLNRLVRPPLEAALWEAVEAAVAGGGNPVVVDAPLLVEWGIDGRFDILVAVTAAEEVRRSRALARGLDAVEFAARARGQLAPEKKAQRADIVIDNSGSDEALEAEADALMEALRARTRERPAGSAPDP